MFYSETDIHQYTGGFQKPGVLSLASYVIHHVPTEKTFGSTAIAKLMFTSDQWYFRMRHVYHKCLIPWRHHWPTALPCSQCSVAFASIAIVNHLILPICHHAAEVLLITNTNALSMIVLEPPMGHGTSVTMQTVCAHITRSISRCSTTPGAQSQHCQRSPHSARTSFDNKFNSTLSTKAITTPINLRLVLKCRRTSQRIRSKGLASSTTFSDNPSTLLVTSLVLAHRLYSPKHYIINLHTFINTFWNSAFFLFSNKHSTFSTWSRFRDTPLGDFALYDMTSLVLSTIFLSFPLLSVHTLKSPLLRALLLVFK